MSTVWIISHVIPLKYFRKRAGRDLVNSGHFLLDITEPGEAAAHVISTNQACVISYYSYLLISSEVD